jgi:orotate phosphoribosyltransferase-like protein
VEKELLSSGSILVVDDVITTGSMTIASVSRLKEAYPRARLRAFGLFRTISSGEIDRIYEPCAGTITLRHGRCTRTP